MQVGKHTVLLAAVLTALSAIHAQQFRLLGHIEGSQQGFIHLYYKDANGSNINDSTTLSNGDFVFTGNIEGATMAYFTAGITSVNMDDPNSTSLVLEPTILYFRGKAGNLKNAVVKRVKAQK